MQLTMFPTEEDMQQDSMFEIWFKKRFKAALNEFLHTVLFSQQPGATDVEFSIPR